MAASPRLGPSQSRGSSTLRTIRHPTNASLPPKIEKVSYAEGELFDSGTITRLSHPQGFSHAFLQGEGSFGLSNTLAARAAARLDERAVHPV